MSILGRKKKKKVIVVLEIASSSAGGMLMRQDKEGKPEIISSVRIPINFLLDVDFDAFWRCTIESVRKVIKKLLKDYPSGPDSVLCTFMSPWFISQTKILNIKREKPFKITEDFFEKLVKEEEEKFKKEQGSRLAQLKGAPKFIDHSIIKTELNGYHVKSPIDKTAKTVSNYIYMGLGIKEVLSGVEEEVFKSFGDVPLVFKTFPFVAFSILSSVINTKEGLILLDIGGEITDISLIRRDFLEETVSFPRGKNFLFRKIASEFNTFPKEAMSILNIYLNGHSSKSQSDKLSKILAETKKEWCELFSKALRIMVEKSPSPQNLFLIGDELVAKKFIECVADESFSQFTVLGKSFNVERILVEGLEHYFDFFPLFDKKNNDITLMLGSLFANKTLNI